MSLSIIDTIEPLGNFPAVKANAVDVNGIRLNEVLNNSLIEISKKLDVDVAALIYATKSEIPKIPTKVSDFQNDAGYLTQHQDLSEYAKKTDIPAVPTKTSQLQNDSGFLTKHQSLADYVQTTDARLSDARPASDVFPWAKNSTKPTYTKSEIGLSNVDNTSDMEKPISRATQASLAELSDKIDGCIKNPTNSINASSLSTNNVSAQIQAALNQGKAIYLDADITLDANITVSNSSRVKITGTGTIDLNGKEFTVGGNLTPTAVGTYTDSIVVVDDASNLNVDDTICIGSDAQKMHTKITAIDDKTISVADMKAFEVNTTIYKMPYTSIQIEGVTIKNGSLTLQKNTNTATVRNCYFKSAELICGGTGIVIDGNMFENCDRFAVSLYSATKCNIINNRISNSKNGIRAQYTYMNTIKDNIVESGKSSAFSIGIEISTETTGKDMCCYNTIDGNSVINGQLGRPGSAVGGIHLNFHAYNNVVSNNRSVGNGIGIYLENDACNNVISNNDCSYNRGWYGVGIELDWNCSNNTIVGNVCNYNSGSLEANEGCGIQVRTSTENADLNNTVVANTCNYNGRCGIYIAGKGLVVADNIVIGNGASDVYEEKGGIISHDTLVGAMIHGNVIKDNVQHGVLIKEYSVTHSFVDFRNNYVTGDNAFEISNVDNLNVSDNMLGNYMKINGKASAYCHSVFVERNKMYSPSNEYTLEMNYVTGYFEKHNLKFRTISAVTLNSCANPFT
ncbi:MAG: right-handed parallel beta-helix repeat-containing protein [Oscillospiraceae bacterium]|nr:right-handed parallel beta-helix repeat-containing protein [Oscillospiraceae bacterium]